MEQITSYSCHEAPSNEPKANILLVDDNPANLLSLRAVLDGLGQNLVDARSGEEALRQLLFTDFAVILLDVQMPGTTGFETATLIRGPQRSRHLPIIFITAHDLDPSQLEEAYALGAVDYLVKPILPIILQAKVRGFVELFQEKQRAKQEADQLRLLVQGTTEYAIFMLDPEGNVLTWNSGAERLKGYKAEEIIGQHFSRFYPQEAIDRGWPAHELKVARAEGRFEDEGWRVRQDGSQFWANVMITALFDEAGTFRGFSKVTRDLTERKKADENARRLAEEEMARKTAEELAVVIREQREQLRVTLQSIGDGVISIDAEGRITLLNPVAQVLTGWTHEEANGRPLPDVFKLLNEQTRQPVENPALRAIKEGVQVGLANHTILIAKDGRERPIDDSAAPIRDENGVTYGAVLVFRDVTERRRTEEQLLRSEQRFARFMQHFPGLAWIKDVQGRYVYGNDAAEKAFAVSRAELYGKTDEEVFPPHTAAQFRQNDRQALSSGAGIQVIESLEQKNGDVHFSLVSKFPIYGPANQVALVGGMAIDITDHMRVERALRESEERFRGLMEQAPFSIQVFSPDGTTVRVNRAWEDLWGVRFDQIDGYNILEDQQLKAKGVLQYIQQGFAGQAAQIPAIQYNPNETIPGITEQEDPSRWLSAVIYPLKDADGQVREVVLIHEDITARKRAEEALKDADRRKDEFLATLAHELRNPLAPIRNSLQILKMPRVDAATTQETRDMMERQVHHLVRLVDDLLDVSRVMRGKIELRKEKVELATVVARAVETAKPLIEVQGHQLDISVPSESLLLDADPVRLAQVVGNLLTNSAKYTEANGHILLTARREGEEAVLTVRDNGIGIAPDMLPHIFELFVQADHSSTKAQGGLGIGLTLVKNLVEMHGGGVEAHSGGLGRGSEFVVLLPLIATQAQPLHSDSDTDLTSVEQTSGHRLLVVDDNHDAAVSFAVLLRLQGHEVRVAHDGPTALEIASTYLPDLIFLDIGMPGMDGYEVARRLRQMPGQERIILAALTGWGQAEDRRRTLQAGFNHHLVKPPEPKAVEQILAALKLRDAQST